MSRKRLLGLWLLLAQCTAAAAAPATFGELIQLLHAQGVTIIYSNSLLRREEPLPAAAAKTNKTLLQQLQTGLQSRDLLLQRRGDIWVVRRAPTPVATSAVVNEIYQPPLENIIVTGSLHRVPEETSGSVHSLDATALATTPNLASDPMRATLRLPGVSSVGISAKPRIRGGLQDELLVLQDGVELLEPFHLADYHSAYSAIDFYTVESMDIYTGGFPSRYGNRMSGVMDIRNDWKEREFTHQLGVSTFARYYNAGAADRDELLNHWQVSIRRGDLSDLTDYIQSRSGKPEYRDLGVRLNLKLTDSLQWTLGGSRAADSISFEDDEESARVKVDTDLLWAGLSWHKGGAESNITVSHVDLERQKTLLSFELEDPEAKGGLLDHDQQVQRWAIRHDISSLHDQLLLEYGWQAEYSRANYRHQSRFDRGDLADILDTPRQQQLDLWLRPRGWSGGAYLQAQWPLSERLVLQPSLRWDYQDYYLTRSATQQVSPRLGLAYQASEDTSIRFSLGRFHQPEGLQELQVVDGVEELHVPQRADQAVFGIVRQQGNTTLRGDVYYKRYDRQKTRFENVFNPFVLLPEMEPDRVGITPSRATIRGLDLQADIDLPANWGAQLRYSYMDARDRIDGRWVDRRWSQSHTFHTLLAWRNDTTSVNLAASWHSGWRSTSLPGTVSGPVAIADYLNNTQLDDHYAIDLGIRHHWQTATTRITLFADINNLTDHKNLAGIDFDLEEGEEEDVFNLVPDFETLLGRVVSVGITLEF